MHLFDTSVVHKVSTHSLLRLLEVGRSHVRLAKISLLWPDHSKAVDPFSIFDKLLVALCEHTGTMESSA